MSASGPKRDDVGRAGETAKADELRLDDPRIKAMIRDRSLSMCLECGKCSGACPRMLTGKEYSPRILAHKLIAEPDSEAYIENAVWECLTCSLCEERCPSGVEVSHFVREMRTLLAGTKGLKGYRSHDGALHSWMRLMTSPDLEQNRLDWLVDYKSGISDRSGAMPAESAAEAPADMTGDAALEASGAAPAAVDAAPAHAAPQVAGAPEAAYAQATSPPQPELKVATSGPLAFFTGCAPYFDVFFSGIEVDTLSIVRGSIRLLNFLDIVPVVLGEERCCGHDLLWTGDRENFEALCRLNYQEFQAAGVEEVVVSCPECYQVLGQFMPEVIPDMKIKVTLLSELLLREVTKGGVSFKPLKRRVTFQDPCRLGRTAGGCETPRSLIEMIPGLTFKEMENHGRGAICCGNNGFINCDAYSKRIQVERLHEAKATRSDLLITACPKCMIHLTCAMRDPYRHGSLAMEIRDLASILAEQIEWSKG